MQSNFIQPSGSTTVQSSGEILSQLLNIPLSSIATLDKNVDLTNYSFAVDPATKEIFNVRAITGVVSGINISAGVAPSGNIGWVCTGTGTFTSTSWAASTAYTLGSRVVKGTSVYEALVAGTSGTTGPVGTVVNATETDGTVTWKLIGPATPTFISLGTYGSA